MTTDSNQHRLCLGRVREMMGAGRAMLASVGDSLIPELGRGDGIGSLFTIGEGMDLGDKLTCSSALNWRSVG